MPDSSGPAAEATPYPPASSAPRTWRRVARLFRPHRPAVLLVLVLVAAFSAFNAAVPLLSQVVIDRALFGPGGPDLPLLAGLAALAAAAACAVGAVDLGQTWVSARTAQRVVRSLREEMYDRLQRMPLDFFATTKGGEIQSRLSGDTAQVEHAIKDTLPGVLAGVLGFVVAGVAMVALSPPLAGAAVVLAPVAFWVSSRSGRALKKLSGVSQQARAELSSIAAERLSLGAVILTRVHGRSEDERAAFAAESGRLARLQVRSGLAAQLVLSVAHVFFVLTPYLVFLTAGLTREMTPGTLLAFIVLQSRLYQPLGQILQISAELRSVQGAFERVFEYLDLRPETREPEAREPEAREPEARKPEMREPEACEPEACEPEIHRHGPGAMAVQGVAFSYPATRAPGGEQGGEQRGEQRGEQDAEQACGQGREPGTDHGHAALREVGIDIPAGSTVLVVGPSGSGKSTLGHLLAGLRRPTEGAVVIDGTEVRGPLPGRLCIVPQDPFLFQGSVAENLRYADPGASPEELVRVCEITRIHERIMALPGGYEARVGERGALFSGGERQRVALARALLADASVLVLDEATSALDPLTEAEVVEAILAERRGRTTVVITHRFGVLDSFDTVVALERGRVAEQGAPGDLRGEPHGLYARMVRAQTGAAR
ncbi:ABC transporter ATP-binding protein [Microtetraspora sp. AC03309]|uniref:ABC transporter ATP-binding protein n=1 Tax=Microtetraspora sp. AC03309 TaxID=2779376 RepID=UPI001E5E8461|nr:ABC transporter ATP-binding protein [Microtetraspora sp. AC03309]MCC5575613.1 ABC transporter ATP-binding protein [Microtetraspora sp. AC03309]